MVENRTRARATFVAFMLPALGLYLFFAMLPLFQGFWLSTTNWDGTAPWTPAQLPIERFEAEILARIPREADRDFLLRYYVRDEGQGTYRKQEVYGLDRYRVTRIIKGTGYENPDFKSVGLGNYRDIFSGGIDRRFFPQRYQETRFQSGDPLENLRLIPKDEYERRLLPHLSPEDAAYLGSVFSPGPEGYTLAEGLASLSELDLQIALSSIVGLEDDWEGYFNASLELGAAGKEDELAPLIAALPAVASGSLGEGDLKVVREAGADAFAIGRLKSLVSEHWYLERVQWGVLLFTGIFVVSNVVLVNVLGLLIALALDRKLKTRNLLRSLFFIPNVLSMIIVAFIWQLVFRQLLPAITGVNEWMMNPDLAPWITILVATWQGLGYYAVIYLAGLQNIPVELVECASLDGAGYASRFRHIVLPLLAPAITICLFLSISGALKTFDIIFALYPSNSTSMGIDNITVNIFYDAFRDKHAGLATAKAILLLLVIASITGTQLALSKRKEVEL